jgi:hypothetical protein
MYPLRTALYCMHKARSLVSDEDSYPGESLDIAEAKFQYTYKEYEKTGQKMT